jgi:hypothetical protein
MPSIFLRNQHLALLLDLLADLLEFGILGLQFWALCQRPHPAVRADTGRRNLLLLLGFPDLLLVVDCARVEPLLVEEGHAPPHRNTSCGIAATPSALLCQS